MSFSTGSFAERDFMYFIKYDQLKEQLRDRNMTDREALPYLILFLAFPSLLYSLTMVNGYNHWDKISEFISFVTAIGGILYAYNKNGGSKGYDLIQKYIVLGWVVFVRVFLACIPAFLFLYIIGDMFDLARWDSTGPYEVVIVFVVEVIVYQRTGRHIRDTNGKNSEPAAAPDSSPLGCSG
jgi:hypothetical protein